MESARHLCDTVSDGYERPAGKRRALFGALLSLCGLLFPALAAEAATHVIGYHPPVLLPDSVRAQYQTLPDAPFVPKWYRDLRVHISNAPFPGAPHRYRCRCYRPLVAF